MDRNHWLVQNTFALLVGAAPIALVILGLVALVPADLAHTKPPMAIIWISLFLFLSAWVGMLFVCSLAWTALMRAVCGKEKVRVWLRNEPSGLGEWGHQIEMHLRKFCELALK